MFSPGYRNLKYGLVFIFEHTVFRDEVLKKSTKQCIYVWYIYMIYAFSKNHKLKKKNWQKHVINWPHWIDQLQTPTAVGIVPFSTCIPPAPLADRLFQKLTSTLPTRLALTVSDFFSSLKSRKIPSRTLENWRMRPEVFWDLHALYNCIYFFLKRKGNFQWEFLFKWHVSLPNVLFFKKKGGISPGISSTLSRKPVASSTQTSSKRPEFLQNLRPRLKLIVKFFHVKGRFGWHYCWWKKSCTSW